MGYRSGVASTNLDPKHAATTALAGFVILTVAMLVVGLLGEEFVFDAAIGRLEHDWTNWIAEHRVAVLDTLAATGSSFTDTWTVIGVAFGASSMLWLTRNHRHALLLPVGLALELTVFLTVSTIIGRERPDVTPLGSVPSTFSFPSGHVAAGVVLYGGLALITASLTRSRNVTRAAAIGATIAVVCVASSRVYEGVHHPTDVIGGAAMGAGALYVAGLSTGLITSARWSRDDVDTTADRSSLPERSGRDQVVTSP